MKHQKLKYIKCAFKLLSLFQRKKVDCFDGIQTYSHLRLLNLYNAQLNQWQRARAHAHRYKRIRTACNQIKAIFQLTKATRSVNQDSLKLGISRIRLHSLANKGCSSEHAGVLMLTHFFKNQRQLLLREPFNLINLKYTGKVTMSERISRKLEPKKLKSLFGSINKQFNRDKYLISKNQIQLNDGLKSTDDEDIPNSKNTPADFPGVKNSSPAFPKAIKRIQKPRRLDLNPSTSNVIQEKKIGTGIGAIFNIAKNSKR